MNTVEYDEWAETQAKECLHKAGLSLLCEWDVLVFLYRHHASLASAEQIARLIGYPSFAVGKALEKLEAQGLIWRSRSSQGVRFYQFVFSEDRLLASDCFAGCCVWLRIARDGC